jgi:hypothetical protein
LALAALGDAQVPSPPTPNQPNPNQPKGIQPQQKSVPTVALAFRNDTKSTIIVQGASIVNGVLRRGQPIPIQPDKIAFDIVPPGVRVISVFDFNRPSRVLLLNFPLPVQAGRDFKIVIRTAPGNPDRVILAPDTGK